MSIKKLMIQDDSVEAVKMKLGGIRELAIRILVHLVQERVLFLFAGKRQRVIRLSAREPTGLEPGCSGMEISPTVYKTSVTGTLVTPHVIE